MLCVCAQTQCLHWSHVVLCVCAQTHCLHWRVTWCCACELTLFGTVITCCDNIIERIPNQITPDFTRALLCARICSWQVGENIILDNCKSDCTCESHLGDLSCTDIKCPTNTKCKKEGGKQSCVCESPYEDVNGDCKRRYTCLKWPFNLN